MWRGRSIGRDLGNRRDLGQSGHGKLNPCGHENREDHDRDANQDGRPNPNSKPAIWRIMNRRVLCIEGNHFQTKLNDQKGLAPFTIDPNVCSLAQQSRC